MAPPPHDPSHKSLIRTQIWTQLRPLALPDSRFSYDFTSFIPDFQGSADATALLLAHPAIRFSSSSGGGGGANTSTIFVAPDNSLETFRFHALRAGKTLLVTTYGLRRGFIELDPARIPASRLELAATLDGMEKVGRRVSLRELRARVAAAEGWSIEVMVTGTGAINTRGERFGKGHGYFDIEWALLYSIGAVSPQTTTTIAVVHDVQVVDAKDVEMEMHTEEFDVPCDVIVTNSRVIEVADEDKVRKPTCGILWDKLAEGMEEDIQPLSELKEMGLGAGAKP